MNYELNTTGLLVPENQKIRLGGRYSGEIVRDGVVIDKFDYKNLITNEGLNSLLNVNFYGATQITAWYAGLFTGNYTPVATDTAAVIAANSTECSAYTAGIRQLFVPGASTAQTILNSASRATYTFNASQTIYGAFLISTSTINGASGVLASAARFAAAKTVASGDQLLLTYSLSAASA